MWLINKISTKLSEIIKVRVTIQSVDVGLSGSLILQNVQGFDRLNEPIIIAEKISATLAKFDFENKIFELKKIKLDHAFVHFNTFDSIHRINIYPIIDKLTAQADPNDKSKHWIIMFDAVEANNSLFSFQSYDFKPLARGVNFKDLCFQKLNLRVRNFKVEGDTVSFDVKSCNFIDKSGISINVTTKMAISKTSIHGTNTIIMTPYSSLNAQQVFLDFKTVDDFNNIFEKVRLNIKLNESVIDFRDVAYFSDNLWDVKEKITFAGRIKGPINHLTCKDIVIKYGEHTSFTGSIDFDGLPDTKATFVYFDTHNLTTHYKDIEKLINGFLPDQKLTLPDIFHKLGKMSYSGSFSGFFNDFVAYGKLNTDLGEIVSDIMIKPDDDNSLKFKGRLDVFDFNLGSFINASNILGYITMHIDVDGIRHAGDKNIDAMINGNINKIDINKYTYQNILLKGQITNKSYNGSISINDPNINFNFIGNIDYSKNKPEFNFNLDVTYANLFYLNIDKSDSSQIMSCILSADFNGNKFENLNGDLVVKKISFSKSNKKFDLKNVTLSAGNNESGNSYEFKSDLMDAMIFGKYSIETFVGTFKKYIKHYLPDTYFSYKIDQNTDTCNLEFEINFKKMKSFTDYFTPSISISDQSLLMGKYDPRNNNFSFDGSFNELTVRGNCFQNLHVNSESDDGEIKFVAGCEKLIINQQLQFSNFTFSSEASQDTLGVNVRWINWDSASIKGNINAKGYFLKKSVPLQPSFAFEVSPTAFIFQDSLWYVSNTLITFDSARISIKNFLLKNNKQCLQVAGTISHNPLDTLTFNVQDMNMGYSSIFISKDKVELGGLITGKACITSFYENPLFTSDLTVKHFTVNNELLGDGMLNAQWLSQDNKLHIKANATDEISEHVNIIGDYFPDRQYLSFQLNFDKVKLNMISPYLKTLVSNIKGTATGKVTLTGLISNPVLNGEGKCVNSGFIVNYLQSVYDFTTPLKIENNTFIIKDASVFDQYGNEAKVDATITHDFFTNFGFNVVINSKKFCVLDTKESDNSTFYGKAFATGIIKIQGTPSQVYIDVNAQSEKNTSINIPLLNSTDVSEKKFITFVNRNPYAVNDTATTKNKYKADLTGITMNFNFDVTPDADVQIIFDPKIGDIIHGRGSGKLNMEINTQGKFLMYGQFKIEEGDYLYTLQNVINKRFRIENGGTIEWNGDPLDATVNLEAIYKTKAALYSILQNSTVAANEDFKTRIPIECQLYLTDKLLKPSIRYDIFLPNAKPEISSALAGQIPTESELIKQFLSLLVINSFWANTTGGAASSSNINGSSSYVVATEFASNQLSNLISTATGSWDVGVNIRPPDQMSNAEVDLALSRQFLNNRLNVSGGVSTPLSNSTAVSTAANPNAVIGDVNVDYKLTKNGKVMIKAFNKANDQYTISQYDQSLYKQGVGIAYREEFNRVGDLFKYYWELVFRRKKTNKTS